MTDSRLQAGGLIQNDHLAMIGVMDIPSHPGDIREMLVFALSGLSDEPLDVDYIHLWAAGLGQGNRIYNVGQTLGHRKALFAPAGLPNPVARAWIWRSRPSEWDKCDCPTLSP